VIILLIILLCRGRPHERRVKGLRNIILICVLYNICVEVKLVEKNNNNNEEDDTQKEPTFNTIKQTVYFVVYIPSGIHNMPSASHGRVSQS